MSLPKRPMSVITEAQSVLTFLEQNPGALKRATDETLGVFPLVFAVKKGDTQLNETLNQAYHVLQSTGESRCDLAEIQYRRRCGVAPVSAL
jgi:hypothetical protein